MKLQEVMSPPYAIATLSTSLGVPGPMVVGMEEDPSSIGRGRSRGPRSGAAEAAIGADGGGSGGRVRGRGAAAAAIGAQEHNPADARGKRPPLAGEVNLLGL
uniref:Uncharacterized protein n=2 Tax=Oryza punctata TaxID=4537 RepID=A0A0E0M545_ORYPU